MVGLGSVGGGGGRGPRSNCTFHPLIVRRFAVGQLPVSVKPLPRDLVLLMVTDRAPPPGKLYRAKRFWWATVTLPVSRRRPDGLPAPIPRTEKAKKDQRERGGPAIQASGK